jgi:hypothetical protein
MKKTIFGMIGIIIIALSIILFKNSATGNIVLENFNGEVKLYKSMDCGCCGIHSDYLQKAGLDLDRIEMKDLTEIKREYNILTQLESCHTTILGNYFIEGHVPSEAIEKLITEKPDISGIALPGMPSGSPGMPGVKNAEWIIYSVNKDGGYEEFMRI